MKIFIDTNVWLRFVLKDKKEFHQQTEKLFTKIESGLFSPYVKTPREILKEIEI